jgi:hypothetical protein
MIIMLIELELTTHHAAGCVEQQIQMLFCALVRWLYGQSSIASASILLFNHSPHPKPLPLFFLIADLRFSRSQGLSGASFQIV